MSQPDKWTQPDSCEYPDPLPRRKPGRPPFQWTDDIKAEILARIAAGETLRQVCRDEHMPEQTIVYELRARDREFAVAYARARDAQLEAWEDEILDIANDGTNDWVDREVARGRIERQVDREHIERSKLRCDQKRWIMSKRAPQRYGDAMRIEGELGLKAVIKAEPMSAEDWAKKHGAKIIDAAPTLAIPGALGKLTAPVRDDVDRQGDEDEPFAPDPGKRKIR
jgi:hypothetical protein